MLKAQEKTRPLILNTGEPGKHSTKSLSEIDALCSSEDGLYDYGVSVLGGPLSVMQVS